MDSEYDRKFEEMKKYIPFLDSMIKRLESSSVPSNPRQAQLIKIRSLRDLLQDKKKRMKMENLLKCEQVLINLYKKVEQRETIQEIKSDSNVSAKSSNLNQVRNKLKSVVSKLNQETLPEIARANETEEVMVPGSKEPALFQRRPNRKSISPIKPLNNSEDVSPQSSKKSYTRVLVSPDRSSKRWSESEDCKADKPLFSRRSPRRMPRAVSPTYHKKERKKGKKTKQGQSKDLNITLNVPEEKLSSLSTDDILSRIINCSDSDVDIATLRELRSQILGELKQTGVKEDISDLLLKSCNKQAKNKESKKKDEIEEGELSDSESEAIESIYGSLIIMDKGKSSSTIKTSLGSDQSRKIQICLVINSDKGSVVKNSGDKIPNTNTNVDISDFESFAIEKKRDTDKISPQNSSASENEKITEDSGNTNEKSNDDSNENRNNEIEADNLQAKKNIDDLDANDSNKTNNLNFPKSTTEDVKDCSAIPSESQNISTKANQSASDVKKDCVKVDDTKYSSETKSTNIDPSVDVSNISSNVSCYNEVHKSSTLSDQSQKKINEESNNVDKTGAISSDIEIPFINLAETAKQEVVSEIDILQALKKEILGESTFALDNDIVTPPLHQPKITKVASAQEIVKNRISIEKYKQKSNSSPKTFKDVSIKSSKEDRNKKQSLKLTEKECSRFNFPIKLPLDESSEDEINDSSFSVDDIYRNLAPKSPDHDDFADAGIKPPVIIPSDPIKTSEVVSSFTDVDMRKPLNNTISSLLNLKTSYDTNNIENKSEVEENINFEKKKLQLVDPRKSKIDSTNRDDICPPYNPLEDNLNSNNQNIMRNPLPSTPNMPSGPNMTPLIAPNMTPVMMTPNSRSFEMTPSRNPCDSEDYPDGKHVYAPLFPPLNQFESKETPLEFKQFENKNRQWEEHQNNPRTQRDVDYRMFNRDGFQNEIRQENLNADPRDSYNRMDYPPNRPFGTFEGPSSSIPPLMSIDPSTPLPSFGRLDCPSTPLPSFGRLDCPGTPVPSFGRPEMPMTPVHPFGRLDGSVTPVHLFGRTDGPMTPVHPFGRSDGSVTPVHPFGRSDGPITPVHPFGRSDGSVTPVHPFSRSDGPITPVHPFGRSDGSLTPVHPFGRSDGSLTPVHPFGRNDYGQNFNIPNQNYGRKSDQRRNRKSRWEDDTEKSYRDFQFNSGFKSEQRSFYSSSESYRRYEPNVSNNEINKSRDNKHDRYYREYSGDRDYRRGRSQSRDSENNRHQSKDNRRGGRKSDNFKFSDSRNQYNQRDKSVSRGKSIERNLPNSFNRSSSVSRSSQNENKLSIQNSAGRSFTIDTSVKRTFQGLDNRQSDNFNVRRQRAASVGRSFVRENGDRHTKQIHDSRRTKSKHTEKSRSFSRARSVGRDVSVQRCDNLNDIKADLRTFKLSYDIKLKKKHDNEKSNRCFPNKDSHKDQKNNSNEKYSPRKNYRDPRIRREQEFDKSDNKSQHNRDSRGYGIVYSDDNISKGTILGPGCSVKNYRIPKIKRSPEKSVVNESLKEIKQNETSEATSELEHPNKKGNKTTKDCNELKNMEVSTNKGNVTPPLSNKNDKDLKAISSETVSDSVKKVGDEIKSNETESVHENINRRITRSHKLSSNVESLVDSPVKRTRKSKKPVIYDSESDTEQNSLKDEIKNNQNDNIKKPTMEINLQNNTSPSQQKIATDKADKKCNDDLNSSFSDIFSDNIASDPVLDNINALIADLDQDLDTSKTLDLQNQFTQEISLENMLENITSSDNMETENSSEVFSVAQEMEKEITYNQVEIRVEAEEQKQKSAELENSTSVFEKLIDERENTENNNNTGTNKEDHKENENMDSHGNTEHSDEDKNEAVVSTTKDDIQDKNEKTNTKVRYDVITAPDSTITLNNASEVIAREVPDSTNESSNDIISINTTSDVQSKDSSIVHSSQSMDQGDTIGKFLSILQDSSRINEVLSFLSEKSSDNEKIKKKLEKLREIVLNDEDDNGSNSSVTKNELGEPEVKKSLESCEATEIKNDTEIPDGSELKSKPKPSIEESANENINEVIDQNTNTDNDSNKNTADKAGDEENNLNVASPTEKHDIDDSKEKELDIRDNSADVEKPEANTISGKKMLKGNRKGKKRGLNKGQSNNTNRLTRSGAITKPKGKKPSRELLNLQADIREMFIKDDILGGTTGIRMCRLAKLVDEKSQSPKDEVSKSEFEPIVRIEKFKNINSYDSNDSTEKPSKKKNIKTKSSKAKPSTESDPYVFETDSFSESCTNEKEDDSLSDCDSDSADSSKSENTERTVEVKKKPKRRRRAWQAGVIVPKNKKKKNPAPPQTKPANESAENSLILENKAKIPDPYCFTDKNYCFIRNVSTYSCRLCEYEGIHIVNHYKKQHPDIEIPLSRMSADIAMEAIKQCEKVNLQSISKLPSNRYVCRFCFKEFYNHKNLLENFFWHIVSVHTGEYKESRSVCDNDAQCPSDLDIPPPPVAQKGQLIGYICGICNYTQVSLENLKNHVIKRHNDKQTEVFTINMSHMSTKTMNTLLKRMQTLSNTKGTEEQRTLRSTRTNVNADVNVDEKSDSDDSDTCDNSSTSSSLQEKNKTPNDNIFSIKSKITFENDSDTDKMSSQPDLNSVKLEPETLDNPTEFEEVSEMSATPLPNDEEDTPKESEKDVPSSDIFQLPHFKISYSESGSKEYICCINNKQHYKSTLLISLKRHVQMKHSEKWDGYCCICKAIVTPLGVHNFYNCLNHFLDNHFDNIPVLEKVVTESTEQSSIETKNTEATSSPKPFLSVRPLSELISKNTEIEYPTNTESLPKIESVVSLGTAVESNNSAFMYPRTEVPQAEPKNYLYEEAQVEIMLKKNRIVLDAMLTHEKLVHVFKCAGRFCSFTTDSAEDALLHASTHTRVGGDNALKCAYCDYDTSDNAIDLITHVFKTHGYCQYVCGFCFYRAAASQLVNAHICRLHGEAQVKTVLKTSFATEASNETTPLTRTDAVPFYTCSIEGEENTVCKFKTYTPGKFCEHITLKHKNTTVYKCFECNSSSTSVAELIQHLKTHGLRLYQCVWCVFGADNENDLLAHASIKHPTLQPQAYLRVITNKEGTTEYRVLPLAHLNKSKIPTLDITPAGVKENPVKEAERSVDLEKLIGHTTHFIESMATTASAVVGLGSNNKNEDTDNSFLLHPSTSLESGPVTPPAFVSEAHTPALNIKAEEPKTSPVKSSLNTSDEIVCLDSDDEDNSNTSNNIVSESSFPKASVETETKLPMQLLYLCSKCKLISKNSKIFKNHIQSCFHPHIIEVPCAYCSFKSTRLRLVKHYTQTHLLKAGNVNLFYCFKCPDVFTSLMQAKDHLKSLHNVTNYNVFSKYLNGQLQCVVGENVKKTLVRRKRSLGSGDKVDEPPAKMKKFGPEDVHQLPINPILDYSVCCALCEFSTKVRLNMVRHLQLHANQQPVPQTAPVNPVPHLETNEKHFDKMVNLASSSLTIRTTEKTNKNESSMVSVLIPAEDAARYPKYVPERQRNTCGAKGCAYISVDENMLKYHWEALHSGSNSFHCVHCPPNQALDTTLPLTASRIITHLKMHDVRLYACSICPYYHYKRLVLEKHIKEIHKTGKVMIVREEISPPPLNTAPPVAPPIAAPTMDLKPWQCGLCEFKSLLRPDVIEHCAKNHQSKMQFKCAYCAFRTSNMENITKHQSLSHQGKPEETFFYYYREGSLPNSDGVPYWQMQKKKYNIPETRVKVEVSETVASPSVPQNPPAPSVDLNIVKKEVIEAQDETIEDICKLFGQFCEPNGLKYKCSLCKNVIEDTKEAMQSHLYEELKYRKWGCSICLYKAFHKRGLSEHMQSEHRQNRDPIELQVDMRIEKWVTKLLEYQESIIEKNKEKLAQQKAEILKQPPGPSLLLSSQSNTVPTPKPSTPTTENTSLEELEKKFGPFGAPVNSSFCCPKCNDVIQEESFMRDHLETELNKIRWCCSACPLTFQSYHQAQFHCKTHTGMSSRPLEAPRDTGLRASWVNAVLDTQKNLMKRDPAPDSAGTQPIGQPHSPEPDNSLLVVRYEERVPTPEVEAMNRTTSEDEKLIIDEPLKNRKRKAPLVCDYCTYSTTSIKFLKDHKLRHYGLQPSTCFYCKLTGSAKTLLKHQKIYHSNQPPNILPTELPTTDPHTWINDLKNRSAYNVVICLRCQSPLMETNAQSHVHDDSEPEFSKFGEVVVKCTTCSTLYKDINKFSIHSKSQHPDNNNYVFYKLAQNKLPQFSCSYCPQKFSLKKDLKAHIECSHVGEVSKQTFDSLPSFSDQSDVILLDDEDDESTAEKVQPPSRKVARKSTAKLPNIRAVAKKSTTKLPFSAPREEEEYSYYGTKPSTDDLENITTLMPFYNTLMPFTYKKLKEVLNITPQVLVEKLDLSRKSDCI
ncbi:uncharacterized protein LOC123700461 [Colias croceus]|uniref:uncharacterized protein LOC123700461 n=1 Tax=Colias crocea TaxID=72248 RepID=UPI001E280343|nr:uncharacterized protein LOC123700461 [Colias croceus]XP_045503630.1 uncharacterized protein LOC123700461 [Colias croceus]XP_045503631.1 uncharacterized protein LOC123700461 [Colias croceus]